MKKIESERFYSVLTTQGAQKLAQASHQGETVLFKYIAVGDGSGSEYQPEPSQTQLKHETYTELESSLLIQYMLIALFVNIGSQRIWAAGPFAKWVFSMPMVI